MKPKRELTDNEILAMLADKCRKIFERYMDSNNRDAAYWRLNIVLTLQQLSSDEFKPLKTSKIIDKGGK